MNDTMTMPTTGNRVRITDMPGGRHTGKIGTILPGQYDSRSPYCFIDGEPGPHDNLGWVIRGWERIDPAIGDTVIAVDVPGRTDYNGKTGKVTEIQRDGCIIAEFESLQKPDDTEAFAFYSWKPLADAPAIESEPPTTDPRIAELERELARANERVDEFRNRAAMWQRDFHRYAERIMKEAIDRDWCSQYEDVMNDIQPHLEVAVIPEREQEFEVEVTVTGTMTTTTTVTVTARSQEDADEIVGENMDDYVDADDILTDAARHKSFDNIECDVE